MRIYLTVLLFVSQALLGVPAFAGLSCSQAFARPSLDLFFERLRFDLIPARSYHLQLRKNNSVVNWKFHDIVRLPDEELGLEFYDHRQQKVTVKVDDIANIEVDRDPTGSGRVKKESLLDTVGDVFALQKVINLIVKPLKKMESLDSAVEVVGTLRTNDTALAKAVAANVGKFDREMLHLGFERPAKTRVVLSDQPLMSDLIGPFSLAQVLLPNVWLGFSHHQVISMGPIGKFTESLRSESALLHERMHSLLNATYVEKAHVNESDVLQEALADFGASFSLSEPRATVINRPDYNLNLYRDVELRESGWSGRARKMSGVLSADAGDYHQNSLLLSGLFWRVYKTIGRENMADIFKNFVDRLNTYYDSYAQVIYSERGVEESILVGDELAREVEFNLAVLDLMADDSNFRAISSELKTVVADYSRELGFNHDRIRLLGAKLAPTQRSFANTESHKSTYVGLVLKVASGALFAGEALLMYFIGSALF